MADKIPHGSKTSSIEDSTTDDIPPVDPILPSHGVPLAVGASGPIPDTKEDFILDQIQKIPTRDHEAQTITNPDARPEVFSNLIQECMFVFTATMTLAMASFVLGATTVITASIGRDLHMNQAEITWSTASAALTSGAFVLPSGRIADIFDRKTILTSSMGAYSAFVLGAAFSPNGVTFNVLGGFIGLCSAAAVPPMIGLLGTIYHQPGKRKNRVFSWYGTGAPLGFVLGAILSGVATQLANWRATFITVAVIYAVMTAMSFWSIPKMPKRQPARNIKQELRKIDFLGSFLVIIGLGMISAGLTMGSDSADGFKTPWIIAMLVVGVCCIVAFVFWQRVTAHPLMPLHIWQDKTFTLIMLAAMLGMAAFNSACFWLALYLQEVQALGPLLVAVYIMPQAIAGICWNIVCGMIMHRVRNEYLMIIAALAYTTAVTLYTFLRPWTSYWAFIFPAAILITCGADFQFNVANMYVLSSFPKHQQSLAGGIFQTLQRLCINLSLAISTAAHTSGSFDPGQPWIPYQRSWYCSVALAATGVLLSVFLRIGTQGGKGSRVRIVKGAKEAEGKGDLGREGNGVEMNSKSGSGLKNGLASVKAVGDKV